MTVLLILGIVVLALVLLSLVRVETRVRWDDQGLRVHVRAGPVEIQIYPIRRRGKAPKKKPPRPAPEKQASAPPGKRDWATCTKVFWKRTPTRKSPVRASILPRVS